MRRTLLQGKCRNGMYPIPTMESSSSSKLSLSAIKSSTEQWHVGLGHPSFKIVGHELSSNNFPFVSNKNSVSHVCVQLVRSKQKLLAVVALDNL
jgi:hypothetical protein